MSGRAYDAVVVGGRVAGASTALLLARAGARVLLLERSRHGSDTVSTHGLMRAGVLQLSRWGLLDEVVRAGTPAVRKTLFHYAGDESVQVSIRPSPGVPALYAPRRRVLDRILVDAAASAGAEIRHEVAVTGLTADPEGRVTGVVARDVAGRSREFRAGLTIGADGIRSLVADAVGARVERTSDAGTSVLYGYFADLPAAGYEWAYGEGMAAGIIPTNDDLACVFVGTTQRLMHTLRREGSEAAFDALFEAAAPDHLYRLRSATRVGRLAGWRAVEGYLRRAWGPGWALVGDAGYFKDPISTHGMTDALRDAELLTSAVLEAASGVTSEAAALSAYQARRDSLSAELFAASGRLAAHDSDVSGVQRLLRELGAAMSDEVKYLQELPSHSLEVDSGVSGPVS
jgi:2-polyprenyl-6-methoxyphenol hydroxylase-like FAD-dependent oxidoreductase